MREIKFRVWNPHSKDMSSKYHTIRADGKLLTAASNEVFLEAMTDVTNEVVMQYTGLEDKNGKEIYKGDIIRLPDTESEYVDVGIGGLGVKVAEQKIGILGDVRVNDYGAYGVFLEDKYNLSEDHQRGFNSFEEIDNSVGLENIEIVGNIYENKDLLL